MPKIMLDLFAKIGYTEKVIIRVTNSARRFFLLSKTSYIAIIESARDVIGSTAKAVESLVTHPITDRAFFIGPYAKNAPMIGLESYGALRKGRKRDG